VSDGTQYYDGRTTGLGAGATRQLTAVFDLPLPADNVEYKLQVRPYQWIAFRGVAVEPGHRTKPMVSVLQVKDADAEAQSAGRIYVGGVPRPGTYTLPNDGLTVLQLLFASGGAKGNRDQAEVRVLRRDESGRQRVVLHQSLRELMNPPGDGPRPIRDEEYLRDGDVVIFEGIVDEPGTIEKLRRLRAEIQAELDRQQHELNRTTLHPAVAKLVEHLAIIEGQIVVREAPANAGAALGPPLPHDHFIGLYQLFGSGEQWRVTRKGQTYYAGDASHSKPASATKRGIEFNDPAELFTIVFDPASRRYHVDLRRKATPDGPVTARLPIIKLEGPNHQDVTADAVRAGQVEVTVGLHDIDEADGDQLLNLDRGWVATKPDNFEQVVTNNAGKWLGRPRSYLAVDFAGRGVGLGFAGAALRQVDPEWWEAAARDGLSDELPGQVGGEEQVERSGMTWHVYRELPKLPLTLVFQTREGNRGVMQITAYTRTPKGVTIRYRMVPQQAAGSNE
jgi:hypothetical protein